MRRGIRTVYLSLEALVCFGPIGLVLLLGVLFFPFWARMGNLPGSAGPPLTGHQFWNFVWPMLAVISAAIGLLGLFRLSSVWRSARAAASRKTLIMIGLGSLGWTVLLTTDPRVIENADELNGQPWDFFYPMALVVCGVVGMAGVVGALTLLAQEHPSRLLARFTLATTTIGISGLILFFWPAGGLPPLSFEAVPALLVYVVLPAIGCIHFLYLACRALFPDLWLSPKGDT